ncbi:MAG TPA: hypothetical protein VLF62_03490, partial [Candidatus Saccharimonadales bacterium]|nr:hypothetical protein [Candidatus Saccharimonadales bacterium]
MPGEPNNGIQVNLDLTKPITVFIEKAANAAGIIYEPIRIKRKAKAEAEATITTIKAEMRSANIRQRAIKRLEIEEIKKQQNMEQILTKAVPQVKANSDPSKIDD